MRTARFRRIRTRHRICRRCGKRAYATERAALADLDRISNLTTSPKIPIRAYHGPCEWWHLTSRKEAPNALGQAG